MNEHLFVSLAGIIVAGSLAQWLAWRLRLPAILLLLGTGLALGPGLAWLDADKLFGDLLLPGISLGVAVILFEGGLGLRFHELKGLRVVLFRLLTVGVALTLGGVAVAAHYILDLSWSLALTLGAILTVTGPTVIGPLLRDIRLGGNVGTLLRWEGIIIDPIGALLGAIAFLLIRTGTRSPSAIDILMEISITVVSGAVLGLFAGILLVVVFRKYWAPDRLHNPITFAVVVGVYALADYYHTDAGLIAVTVMGMALANQRYIMINHLVEFKETLVTILLSALFVILGSRIKPTEILDFGGAALLFVIVLILLVRPIAVIVSTVGTGLTFSERVFLAAMAPRGVVAVAIASVFALGLAQSGVPRAERLLSATVLSVIGTVLVYGLCARFLASWLKLVNPNPQGILFVGASNWVCALAKTIVDFGGVVTIIDTDWRKVTAARMAGLPVVLGSALSEELLEELDTSSLCRLLATTPNEELNALVCQRFAEVFGRAEVYHVSPGTESGRYITLAPEQRGRDFLTAEWTYQAITDRFEGGGEFRGTKLSEEFTFADWQKHYAESALPMILARRNGAFLPFLATGPKPATGDTVIALYATKKQPAGV